MKFDDVMLLLIGIAIGTLITLTVIENETLDSKQAWKKKCREHVLRELKLQ